MYQADIIVADSGYLQGYIVCCAMYFLICFPLAMLVTWLEKRSKAPRKAKATHAVPAATADGEV
jgi:putative glutamine transport system permease protein